MYVIDKVDLFKLQYYTMYKLSIPVPVFLADGSLE
jgi:hypothetical protein